MRSRPWSGKKRTLALETTLVRLDADAQHDHGVDVGVRHDGLHHGGDGVLGLAAGEVDRVVPAPAGRQQLVEGVAEVVGQREQLERGARQRVGGDHAPSADGGDDRDLGPRRGRLGGEGGGDVEGLLHGGGAHGPGLAAHAVEDLVVGGERTGVAGRGAGPDRRGSALEHHDGEALGHRARAVRRTRARRGAPRRRRGRRWSRGRRRRTRGSRAHPPGRRCRPRRPGSRRRRTAVRG